MEGKDPSRPGPSIGKFRCIIDPAHGMTAGTGRPIRKIGGPHQHGMSGIGMLGMTIKVSAMAGNTFAASGLTDGATYQRAIDCAMARLTGNSRMGLTDANKRCCGRSMATDTVGSKRRVGGIDLDQGAMILAMTGKVGAMTGRTSCPRRLTVGTANELAIATAMARLTGQMGRLGLNSGHIRCCGCRMAVYAECHGRHAVGMTVGRKVGAMTRGTGSASRLAKRAADQEPGRGTVTGLTGEVCGLGLHPGHIGRRAAAMATGAQCNRGHAMTMGVTNKESTAMAGNAGAAAIVTGCTACRHGHCGTEGRL